jgi:TolA protein
MELGDAMAALRNELGESVPAPMEAESSGTDAATSELANAGESDGASRGGVQVSPEMMRWITLTRQHVRERWVNPPEFLGRGYVTELGVQLRADGTVVGRPEVRRSSGDPYADDNAVRAIMKASPLPAPPSAGLHVFLFVPEATQ